MSTSIAKHSWRDFWKIHRAAEVFPIMEPDKLRKLADDIQANGLSIPIQTRSTGPDGDLFVIDGRNRLDAMELLGWQLVDAKGGWAHHVARRADGTTWSMDVEYKRKDDSEIVKEVISLNIHRRHLTKAQQVELIDKALKAVGNNDSVKITRSFSPVAGKKGGSTKSHTGKVVEQAKKAGISESTVKKVLAKATPKPKREPRPATEKIDIKLNKIIDEVHELQPPQPEFGKVLIYVGKQLIEQGERLRMTKNRKPASLGSMPHLTKADC